MQTLSDLLNQLPDCYISALGGNHEGLVEWTRQVREGNLTEDAANIAAKRLEIIAYTEGAFFRSSAAYMLGCIHLYGANGTVDFNAAEALFTYGYRNHEPFATYGKAVMHENGWNCNANIVMAKENYNKALKFSKNSKALTAEITLAFERLNRLAIKNNAITPMRHIRSEALLQLQQSVVKPPRSLHVRPLEGQIPQQPNFEEVVTSRKLRLDCSAADDVKALLVPNKRLPELTKTPILRASPAAHSFKKNAERSGATFWSHKMPPALESNISHEGMYQRKP